VPDGGLSGKVKRYGQLLQALRNHEAWNSVRARGIT